MKRALQMGIDSVMVATGLALGSSPAGATVCTIAGVCTGDTAGTGVNQAFARSGSLQVAGTADRLGVRTPPPNPVRPGDPYSPGFGVLTARPLAGG